MERGRLTFNGSFFADARDYIIICMHVHTCLLRGSIFAAQLSTVKTTKSGPLENFPLYGTNVIPDFPPPFTYMNT